MPKKKATVSRVQQRLLAAAAAQMEQEAANARTLIRKMYLHSVLAQTYLPHSDPGQDVRSWHRKNGNVALRIEAGAVADPEIRNFVEVGIPFGVKPRLILAHLTTEAINTKSRELGTADTVTRFVGQSIGAHTSGRNIVDFKRQLARLMSCRINLALFEPGHTSTLRAPLTDGMMLWAERDKEEKVVWPVEIRFSEIYFEHLLHHAIPLNEAHLLALGHTSLGLDIYTWLAQRLFRVKGGVPQSTTWAALFAQFGAGYTDQYNFRQRFRIALDQVQTVYRAARIDRTDAGLDLWQSPPPVPRALVIPVRKKLSG